MSIDFKTEIEYIKTHPWHKKVFKKLGANDIEVASSFFNKTFNSKGDAVFACNRYFMDKPNKPIRWKEIQEVISCIITHHYRSP